MSSDYALIIADNEETKEIKILGDFWYDRAAAEPVARCEAAKLSKEWRVRVCNGYATGWFQGTKP